MKVTRLATISRALAVALLVFGCSGNEETSGNLLPDAGTPPPDGGADAEPPDAEPPDANLPSCGADANPTGNPIGGGVGYTNIVDSASADYLVSDKNGLLGALNNATSGQIVYVCDTAEIDLSGEIDISVPAGVTVASGRGRNGSSGGLLFTSTMTYQYEQLFRPADHVTFNGIRLRGPTPPSP